MKVIWGLSFLMLFLSCETGTKRNTIHVVEDKVMYVSTRNDSVISRTIVWGLAGGHEKKVIFLSDKLPNDVACDNDEVCILGDAPLFYQGRNDTLLLYSEVLDDTVRRMGSVVVKQSKITALRRVLLEENYESWGLSLIGKVPK